MEDEDESPPPPSGTWNGFSLEEVPQSLLVLAETVADAKLISVKLVFNLWLLFHVFEFLRRVLQVGLDGFRHRGTATPFLARLRANLGLNFRFFSIGVVPLAIVLRLFPAWFVKPELPTVLALVPLFISYCTICHYVLHLSSSDRRDITQRSSHDLGPGLALGFYRYLENVLQGEQTTRCFHSVIEDNLKPDESSANSCRVFTTTTPVIVFPDLTSPFYSTDLSNPTLGLISGLVKRENEVRAVKGEEEMVHVRDGASYEYKDKAGLSRKSTFTVISMKELDLGGKYLMNYYFVCDNRPIPTILTWFNEKFKPDEREANLDVLRYQLESYQKRLNQLLETDLMCRGRYHSIYVKGMVSDSLRTLKKSLP